MAVGDEGKQSATWRPRTAAASYLDFTEYRRMAGRLLGYGCPRPPWELLSGSRRRNRGKPGVAGCVDSQPSWGWAAADGSGMRSVACELQAPRQQFGGAQGRGRMTARLLLTRRHRQRGGPGEAQTLMIRTSVWLGA